MEITRIKEKKSLHTFKDSTALYNIVKVGDIASWAILPPFKLFDKTLPYLGRKQICPGQTPDVSIE